MNKYSPERYPVLVEPRLVTPQELINCILAVRDMDETSWQEAKAELIEYAAAHSTYRRASQN